MRNLAANRMVRPELQHINGLGCQPFRGEGGMILARDGGYSMA
jgi:hypothetical protein